MFSNNFSALVARELRHSATSDINVPQSFRSEEKEIEVREIEYKEYRETRRLKNKSLVSKGERVVSKRTESKKRNLVED